ncbi:flagellar protein FlaG [Brevibacillus centrosporus]|uniref:flagellar protein FlaG n=1 Tax=Brevibacillus centrosporus TaxID=54910 RepID=UPI002E1A5D14|nr:flagellar protein FlaG [Brevibacillus centrosporus]
MEIGVNASTIGRNPAFTEGGQAAKDQAVKATQTEGVQEKELSKAELTKEIKGINKWLETTNTHVKFTLHDKLNEYYVQVINDQTNEVIREIPSKKMMDMVAKMHEMVGLLVDERR